MATRKPIVAIMYDFDKTLCTKDMQEYGFIPALGMEASAFWGEVKNLTDEQEMDNILAYMFLMVQKCKDKKVLITKESFQKLGEGIEFFDGVTTWFERINAYGKQAGVRVEHYIVSSGIKEIIEGTSIAHYFKKIYACEFMYDYTDTIQWPKFAVNYTAKTQFLFRINKGVLTIDSSSAGKLNMFTPENERRVPFRNMIYIGDGLTDVPCMKLVKSNGGQSIAVYDPERGKEAAMDLLKCDRVNFIAPAEYGANSDIEEIVMAAIMKIKAEEELRALI
ncbi:HAD family hydrolase [Phascolarctobacterium sp.]|uniref:HAD family hydrolase n=1 Tax=Phascolarctobacterium sp. TaxID=2049039 RepID=UPI00386E37B6